MIRFTHKGDFSKTKRYLKKMDSSTIRTVLNRYGQKGVDALAAATPVRTGLTANSWYYEIEIKNGTYSISFFNSNIQNGVPIAVILQYGHGTRNGGWVQGRNYIEPAIQPIFDQITKDLWREVTSL